MQNVDLTDPPTYLRQIARPLCNRFRAEPLSFDLAFATCAAIFHFVDVLAHATGRETKVVAKEFRDTISGFELVRALANTLKHTELTTPKYHPDLGLKSSALSVDIGGAFSDGTYYSDNTSFTDSPQAIVLTRVSGEKRDVLWTCLSVLEQIEALHLAPLLEQDGQAD
ncbi:MAG: hypothetical protein ACK42D_04930 [Candidatus Paceibacteria bacterium]